MYEHLPKTSRSVTVQTEIRNRLVVIGKIRQERITNHVHSHDPSVLRDDNYNPMIRFVATSSFTNEAMSFFSDHLARGWLKDAAFSYLRDNPQD